MTASNEEIADYLEGGATALADGAVIWMKGDLGGYMAVDSVAVDSEHIYACAFGACNYAKSGWPKTGGYRYEYEIRNALQEHYHVETLVEYNDQVADNVDEVVEALRVIAKDFRNASDVLGDKASDPQVPLIQIPRGTAGRP